MAWKVYKTIFQLKSPLHIGFQRLGMIQRTRHYIPAMTMWGALTYRLTQLLFSSSSPDFYNKVGEFCNTQLLTSYFFPCVKVESNYRMFMPSYTGEGKWMYGCMGKAEFERRFLKGYGSTAIDPSNTASLDASLHEIQLLLPKVYYDDSIFPVSFWGYIFACADNQPNADIRLVTEPNDIKLTAISDDITASLSSSLTFLQVGGERTYGYGRLSLKEFCQTNEDLWGSYAVETDKERPILRISTPENSIKSIPAHLQVESSKSYNIEGDVEPVVSRQWGKSDSGRGAGESLNFIDTCFTPGSVLKCGVMIASIERFGILKPVLQRHYTLQDKISSPCQ